MKKIIIGLSLVLLLLIFVILLIHLKNDRETYYNLRYDFSIDYPKNWQLGEPETNNAGRTIKSPDQKIECYAYGFENALTNEEDKPQTLQEFVSWLTSNEGLEPRNKMHVTVIESKNINISGRPGAHLVLQEDTSVKEAVYALGEEKGIGFFCTYPDLPIQKELEKTFYSMAKSIKINTSLNGEENVITGTGNCVNLVNGVTVPLKDYQTFIDEKYLEVTLISRENWDKEKLSEQVLELEKQDYQCYPMPYEFEPEQATPGIQPERAVTKVQWQCQLDYKEWQYLVLDDLAKKAVLEKQGYKCQKEECLAESGGFDSVWLCTK